MSFFAYIHAVRLTLYSNFSVVRYRHVSERSVSERWRVPRLGRRLPLRLSAGLRWRAVLDGRQLVPGAVPVRERRRVPADRRRRRVAVPLSAGVRGGAVRGAGGRVRPVAMHTRRDVRGDAGRPPVLPLSRRPDGRTLRNGNGRVRDRAVRKRRAMSRFTRGVRVRVRGGVGRRAVRGSAGSLRQHAVRRRRAVRGGAARLRVRVRAGLRRRAVRRQHGRVRESTVRARRAVSRRGRRVHVRVRPGVRRGAVRGGPTGRVRERPMRAPGRVRRRGGGVAVPVSARVPRRRLSAGGGRVRQLAMRSAVREPRRRVRVRLLGGAERFALPGGATGLRQRAVPSGRAVRRRRKRRVPVRVRAGQARTHMRAARRCVLARSVYARRPLPTDHHRVRVRLPARPPGPALPAARHALRSHQPLPERRDVPHVARGDALLLCRRLRWRPLSAR